MSAVKAMRCPTCRTDEGHDAGCPLDLDFERRYAEALALGQDEGVPLGLTRTAMTDDEPTRCGNCGRLANTSRAYAICQRCEDELNAPIERGD